MKPQAFWQKIRRFEWRQFLTQPIFQDKISQVAILATIGLTAATVVTLGINVQPSDYPVPTHYASHIGFDQTGPWYVNYQLGFFAVAVTAVNLMLAAKSFRRNRVASFFLLLGALVISLFCLVISSAFSRYI